MESKFTMNVQFKEVRDRFTRITSCYSYSLSASFDPMARFLNGNTRAQKGKRS